MSPYIETPPSPRYLPLASFAPTSAARAVEPMPSNAPARSAPASVIASLNCRIRPILGLPIAPPAARKPKDAPGQRQAVSRCRSEPDRPREGRSPPRQRAIAVARGALVEAARVERDAGDDGRPGRQRDALVELDERGERRNRVARAALDLRRSGHVAEHERVRRRPVDETERDARVHRVDERALPLDEEQRAAALDALDHEALGGAREEVGDDRVDGDPPAGDGDAGLARGNEHRFEAAVAGLADRARRRRSSCRSRSPSRR